MVETAETDNRAALTAWAAAALGLSGDADGENRRRAALKVVGETGFAPALTDALVIRLAIGQRAPRMESDNTEFENVGRQLAFLRETFDSLADSDRLAALDRMAAYREKFPSIAAAIEQFRAAEELRNLKTLTDDSQSLPEELPRWLLLPPTQFAANRLRWFDAKPEENRLVIERQEEMMPEILRAVPGFENYLRPVDPRVGDTRWAKRQRDFEAESLAVDWKEPQTEYKHWLEVMVDKIIRWIVYAFLVWFIILMIYGSISYILVLTR